MTTPITTPEEMLEAVLAELHNLGSATEREGDVTYLLTRNVTARAAFEALRSRIPPPAPQPEPAVRISPMIYYAPDCPTCGARHGNAHRDRACLAPCDEPAPQPTVDDVVRAVESVEHTAGDPHTVSKARVIRAIRAAFAAGRKP